MIGIFVAILLAILAYALVIAFTHSGLLALAAGILVLIAGIGYPHYGDRFGGPRA